jgi:AmmeMemoRadiSam system protein A
MLTTSESEILLTIAKDALQAATTGQDYHPKAPVADALNKQAGCFVTLKKQGQLRGCLGNFQAQGPLFEEVATMAAAAATQDPRFHPVQPEELEHLELEITVLSPRHRINDFKEIEIGRHGIYIKKGRNCGVLLPQVATEYAWDRQTFLEQTCRKAGLPTDAWLDTDCEIYIFSGQIIADKLKRKDQ